MKTLRIPFSIDSRGGLAYTESTQRIVEQQIIDIVATADYERIMNPHYGAGVPNFLFASILTNLLTAKAEEVRDRLKRSVQLADIVSVDMSPSSTGASTVVLDIRYTISPSPTVFSVQHTVSGLITDETTFGVLL